MKFRKLLVCGWSRVPVDADESLEDRIFAPERVEQLLRSLLDRARNQTAINPSKAEELRKKLCEVEERIERMYAALADGTVGDTDMFRRSLAQIEGDREETLRMIAALERHREVPRHLLTKSSIARFVAAVRARLRDENASLRKRYIRLFVSRIDISDREIRIMGPKSSLAEGVLASGSDAAAGVPSFVQGWWARQDSNLRQHRYERRVLTS
jgi:site-specific DNA recombinase